MSEEPRSYEVFAEWYDAIYSERGKDYSKEADEVSSLILARNPGAKTLLDVGCGTGGHLQYLQARFQCTGADPSSAMLQVARRKLPGLRLITGDSGTDDLGGEYDAIVCLFSSIAYTRTKDRLASSLANLAAHLRPGGVLLVDGWISPADWDSGSIYVDVGTFEGGKVVRVNHSGEEDGCSILTWHFVVGTEDGLRWFEERHVLGLFESDDYLIPLRQAGLSVELHAGDAEGRDRFVAVRSPG
jgi:SAM-dependent methyltransferase